jgi:hypothetical protein
MTSSVTLEDQLADLEPSSRTLEDIESDLCRLELQIAQAHGLRGRPIRLLILGALRAGRLVEDNDVAQWVALFSTYEEWCKDSPPYARTVNAHLSEQGRHERPFAFLFCA